MPRKSAATGESAPRRHGPKPLLPAALEAQLVQWVLAQQGAGRRVSRDDVIGRAQELARAGGEARAGQPVGIGWCNRFVARHPALSLRPGASAIIAQRQSSDATEANVNFTEGGGTLPSAAVDDAPKAADAKAPESSESESKSERAEDAAAPIKTRKYNRKHMEAAVDMLLAGSPMSDVAQRFPLLHQRTIRRRVLRVQRGEVDRRRGPRPLLEGGPEQDLVAWILDLQSRGTRVTKKDILARANEQYRALTGETAEDRLKEGWLRRFKERHPVLSGRAPTEGNRKRQHESNSESEAESELSASADRGVSSARSAGKQQELAPVSAVEEKQGSLKRLEASAMEGPISAPKRRRTASSPSIRSSTAQHTAKLSDSVHESSSLPGRHQAASGGNPHASEQSNNRLEELQRQQLAMLQQLCASNDVLSRIAGPKRAVKDASTE
ncbi:unnamed protein product [Phytophthora fragariaefolia]|uniref:Unnamed protein product n=1 Tax=Phytophthora fragariaefolia TaxID=1490495 RepID=A0A9W6XU60_9STRA|nr:unnamed protein product [Phytophthora fragariaefolia]